DNSGIWLPIVIKKEQTNINFVDILSRAESEKSIFNPCDCVSTTGDFVDEADAEEDISLNCSYCNADGSNYGFSWQLVDQNTNKSSPGLYSDCCGGACDVRMTKDDYLAKLPVLNSSYITKFYDWKNKLQFPACSNKGLGYEQFAHNNVLSSFKNSIPKLIIDWKIKERISEIPPNDADTYHKDIDTHEKSYTRSLINSKTCGNFLLTKLHASYINNPIYSGISGLIGDVTMTSNFAGLLPAVKDFTKPYGFKDQDHFNIFAKTEKVGSYWKWNYSSGILCWYRYFDIDLSPGEDNRLIKGVDLYVSDGDVFYATNDGPEATPVDPEQPTPPEIKSCPSGLKLIKNNSVIGIIPSGSEFIYISENLYGKAHSIINRLDDLEASLDIPDNNKISPINKLQLSALLATGPNYYEVTVDLLKTVPNIGDITNNYARDIYKQIKVFNSGMLLKQQHKANKLNIVKTKEDLVNTLVNKYGCYIWCPPKSTISLDFKNSYDSHGYIDLDFEPVVKESDTFFSRQCSPPTDCLDTTIERNFSYDQKITVGNQIFNTTVDKRYKSQICNSGQFSIDKAVNVISAYFNNRLVKEQVYGSGCTVFNQKYLRAPSYDLALDRLGTALCSTYKLCSKSSAFTYNNNNDFFGTSNEVKEGKFENASVILDRRYPANASNINIDRIGFHKEGGLYYDSNNLGSGNVVFLSSTSSSAGSYSIEFKTKDVGIKLYDISIHHLRDKKFTKCKTFPLDQSCKCFPLSSVDGYRYNCDGSLTFSNEGAVLYTPNLSTQFSPLMLSYGGYSIAELSNIVQEQRIPNHPTPGTTLVTVNRIIDPINPYGCTKEISPTFPNYVHTKWSMGLPNYSTDHTDVWMKISENVSLFNPTIPSYDPDTGDFETINNPSYRRYTTKAVINGTTVYNAQQQVLFDKDTSIPNSFDVELTNPFLFALISELSDNIDENKLLYTNLPCSLDTISRDTYLNNIVLTFKQVPRKQVLNYKIQPLSSAGTLKKTFFHPNKGIVNNSDLHNLTSLIFNKKDCSFDFAYEKELFENEALDYSDDGIMFSGHISNQIQQILNLNDNLLNHKKLRLYVKYNSIWYEYLNPHLFGFNNKVNNNTYPGLPTYFEYAKQDKYKTFLNISEYVDQDLNDIPLPNITTPSQLIPVSAKINTEFFYLHNVKPTGTITGLSKEFYPLLHNNFILDKSSKRKIVLRGSRPYFMFEEKDPAVTVTKISTMSSSQESSIFRNTFVLEDSGSRWRYKGEGSKTSLDSYELVPSRGYIDNNFNELWINYVNSNDDGYVANTELKTKS
ncbi:MAG: hypothetical protein WD512_11370, partial [Candidatus Paceibacterota bacterium]